MSDPSDPSSVTGELPPDITFTIDEVAYVLTRHMEPDFAAAGRPNGWADPAVAVALVMAESGGRSGAIRDESQNPLGGRDRGWWQINSKANPDVTDGQALRPLVASRWVFDRTQGGNDFSCWAYHFSPPRTTIIACPNYRPGTQRNLDLGAAAGAIERVKEIPTSHPTAMRAMEKLLAASTTSDDTVQPDPGIPGLDSLLGLLRRILSALVSPEWWRRVGIGVLGVGLLLVALAALVARG